MKELKSLCEGLGWSEVKTCLQTGNIAFTSDKATSSLELESDLETAIESQFGFSIPVVSRTASAFEKVLASNPLLNEAEKNPSHVILYLSKDPVQKSALQDLQEKANANEQVCVTANALWIYFPNDISRSKLSPKVIDKAVGSATTGRNWKTALKIQDLASV